MRGMTPDNLGSCAMAVPLSMVKITLSVHADHLESLASRRSFGLGSVCITLTSLKIGLVLGKHPQRSRIWVRTPPREHPIRYQDPGPSVQPCSHSLPHFVALIIRHPKSVDYAVTMLAVNPLRHVQRFYAYIVSLIPGRAVTAILQCREFSSGRP